MELTGSVKRSPKKGRRKSLGKSPKAGIAGKDKKAGKRESSGSEVLASGCLEGMSAAEMTMVRRLAGNDPNMRKKTMKKLKKWLSVLSQKVPDGPEARSIIEPNFIRVWKALFYCMWMADKPLPQEQLAESVSDLQNLFAEKTAPFLLFVEWFIRTMAREWSWIDRFRMDKFMMLFRRFTRKTLAVISSKKWHNDILNGYLKIVSVHLFNHHPTAKKSPVAEIKAPLGLQIHFVDIFMEELAKVGGSSLKSSKILKILQVFMSELAYSNDERLLDEVRERIFNHLMRQSDVGIDYQEGVVDEGEEDELGEAEENSDQELGEEDQYLEDEADDEGTGVLDPRAGAVDVILPQLEVDYSVLYQKLIECGGQKDVKLRNRRMLYSLASQFKELTEGKYPLALPEETETKPAISKKQYKKAAKELLEFELSEGSGKKRKSKKERRRDMKRKMNSSQDSVGSEDNSRYIQDEDLLDHVDDNFMSYLEDQIETGPEEAQAEEAGDEIDASAKHEKKEKGKKGKKRKWTTEVEVEADEVEQPGDENTRDEAPDQVVVIKKPKLNKRMSLGNTPSVTTTPLRGKAKRMSELRTPTSAIGSPAGKKRVSFVLARNLEHPHADYTASIARSPQIPFDKNKRPGMGLLKSPAASPNVTPLRRAQALDFF